MTRKWVLRLHKNVSRTDRKRKYGGQQMKELKHLIYFESLLEDANNELVRQAQSEGGLAVGYTCFHAPEVLLNLGKSLIAAFLFGI